MEILDVWHFPLYAQRCMKSMGLWVVMVQDGEIPLVIRMILIDMPEVVSGEFETGE
jgi:hypothetical protein